MKRSGIRRSAIVGIVVAAATAPLPAVAAGATKPAPPVIIKISPVSVSGKLARLRVLIEKPAAGVTSTVIEDGRGASCTIKGTGTSCVMNKVSVRNAMRVRAQSRSGKVSGSKSPVISMRPLGTYVRVGYDVTGVKYPAPVNGSQLAKQLGASVKWTKIQALKRGGVTTAGLRQARVSASAAVACSTSIVVTSPTTTTTAPIPDEPCVVFQLSGAVALALSSASGSCGTNGAGQSGCAVAVAADGSNPSLYAPGSVQTAVRDFYSAPNGKFYVAFYSQVRLTTRGTGCVFAEVNLDTGIPTCVDPELTNVTMGLGMTYGLVSNGNPPIQFDDAGNVYYSGMASSNGSSPTPSFTLRKNVGGVISKIVNDNITVRDFLVQGDGTVLITGLTMSSQLGWLRKISPGGAITNLSSNNQSTFLRKFVDGNSYYGIAPVGPSASAGVYRYVAATGKVDDVPWMAGGSSWYTPVPTQNDLSTICLPPTGPTTTMDMFCSYSGGYIKSAFNIGKDKTLAVTGSPMPGQGTSLVQYYPTVVREATLVTNVSIAYQVGTKLVLTGLDATGKNIVTVFDPSTHQETVIFDGSNEVEIYSIGYVGTTGKVMFNGLSFATGQVVVGEITIP